MIHHSQNLHRHISRGLLESGSLIRLFSSAVLRQLVLQSKSQELRTCCPRLKGNKLKVISSFQDRTQDVLLTLFGLSLCSCFVYVGLCKKSLLSWCIVVCFKRLGRKTFWKCMKIRNPKREQCTQAADQTCCQCQTRSLLSTTSRKCVSTLIGDAVSFFLSWSETHEKCSRSLKLL